MGRAVPSAGGGHRALPPRPGRAGRAPVSGLTVRARSGRRRAATAHGPLPTFLVIGAMKAGTDSLWHYLRAHPRVHMSETKELDFFVSELNWRRGLPWYRSRFSGASADAVAVGEASTSYSKHPVYAGV